MTLRFATILMVLFPLLSAAEDWPQWRGPDRDGILPPASAPTVWPEHLKAGWKIEVGEGYSSPILANGKIIIFTRQQGKETLRAIEPAKGRILWQQSYPAPYKMSPVAERHGEGPKSTPVYHDGKVYTLGISGILTSWDAATGAVRWRKDFSAQFRDTWPLFGAAMSPMVDRGLLIAHVGGNDNGALAAFDAATGRVKWQWTGDGPAYASPIVFEAGGVRQIVTQTQKYITGFSSANGELLWRIPFETEYVQNIVTPLAWRDLLIFSGVGKGVFAVRLNLKAGAWAPETVWKNQAVSMYMNSPVAVGDRVFGFSHLKFGQFFALDARTGHTLWTGDPRQADNAAILAAGGHLILLKDDGELLIAKADSQSFALQRRYTVATSSTYAHPLVLPTGVVIKDQTSLALWSAE